MSEIGKLSVVIDANTRGLNTGLGKAKRRLSDFNQKAGETIGSMAKLAGAITFAGTSLGLMKLTKITREFDVLNAGLKTATGSTENASKAFEALQGFAAKTPYSLDQSVNAFIKLRNLGLTPSEKAMQSYGNTASAMGKSLNQMIEAVADASTMEFERLKEFGIKTKQQGNSVKFTFQGVTTTVKKNAKEIEGYLMKLGESKFGGAMAERAKTLDGSLSNLGDTWDALFLSISKSGLGKIIQSDVNFAIKGIQHLINEIRSGKVTESFNLFGGYFSSMTTNLGNGLNQVTKMFQTSTKGWITGFNDLPPRISAAFSTVVLEMTILGKKIGTILGEYFSIDSWTRKILKGDLGVSAKYKREMRDIDKEYKAFTKINQDNINKTFTDWENHFIKLGSLETKYIELRKQKAVELQGFLAQQKVVAVQSDEEDPELVKQKEKNASKEQEEARHLQAMTGLRESSFNATSRMVGKAYGGQAGMIASAFQDILTSTATYSKKAFEMQKKAAIANAIVNAYEGISKTLSRYPMPVAGVLAAAHAAAGFAQVKAIKSQSFSGGGSGGAVSTGGGSTSIPTTGGGSVPSSGDSGSTSGQIVNIALAGDSFGREQVRNLINSINDALSDGAQLNLT